MWITLSPISNGCHASVLVQDSLESPVLLGQKWGVLLSPCASPFLPPCSSFNSTLECKGKGERGFVQRLVVNTPLRRSGMARML